MLFQNRPAGDKRGPCERPGAREHCVGDPCSVDSVARFLNRKALILDLK